MNDKEEEMFREQLAEAWAFYKHLETQRFQYLGLFFTVLGVGAGFVVTLLTPKILPSSGQFSDQLASAGTLFGVSIILVLLFSFSSIIYAVIVRLNMYLDFYGDIMKRTRAYFFDETGYASMTWNYSSIGLHPINKKGGFRVQRAVTSLLGFLTTSILAAQTTITWLVFESLHWCAWRTEIDAAMTCVMIVALFFLFRAMHSDRKNHRQSRELADQTFLRFRLHKESP